METIVYTDHTGLKRIRSLSVAACFISVNRFNLLTLLSFRSYVPYDNHLSFQSGALPIALFSTF